MFAPPTGLSWERVDIRRPVRARQGDGTFKTEYTPLRLSAPALVQDGSASEFERYGRDGATCGKRIIIDANVAMQEQDRIEHRGRKYDVLGVKTPASTGAFVMVDAEEVK